MITEGGSYAISEKLNKMKRIGFSSLTLCLFLLVSLASVPAYADDSGSGSEIALSASGENNLVKVSATTPAGSAAANGAGERYSNIDPLAADSAETVSHRINRKALHWCLERLRVTVSSHVCLKAFEASQTETDEETAEESIPDDVVMNMAIAHARIDGAGVIITPGRDWVYAGVPVLARAQTSSVDTAVELFNLTFPVHFEATEFVFDFHDGQAPTRSATPGIPYPDMTIQGTYYQPDTMQHVTLHVTWRASVTHPLTGQTLTLDAALKTTENSREFRVEKPRVRLVAP